MEYFHRVVQYHPQTPPTHAHTHTFAHSYTTSQNPGTKILLPGEFFSSTDNHRPTGVGILEVGATEVGEIQHRPLGDTG